MPQKTLKYYLWILGCQMNSADGERIAAVLENLGYQKTNDENEADLIMVVACSVRQSAIDRIYGKTNKWNRLKLTRPLITVLSGCLLEHDKQNMSKIFDLFFDINDLAELPRLLNNHVLNRDGTNLDYFNIQPRYQNSFQAYVPISTGCNNFCSYCVVPFTRGREKSRASCEIIEECQQLINNGYKEITLLGQNVNSYGQDLAGDLTFPKLLQKINDLNGNFWLRFITSHPKDMTDELINVIAKNDKIANYIHLPFQAGDNEILKKMNRKYTQKHYLSLIEKIKSKIPDVSLSTDVIVGFPGETKRQFQNTVKLFKEVGFDMAYISQFSSRPGTAASKMENNVSNKEKQRRWEVLNRIIVKKIKERRRNKAKKLIVVLGPTASGKSDLAVNLAKKFGGGVVSADSRQVYRGMNIGTGKITKKEMQGVPHYLLDVTSPKRRFAVVQYRNLALKAINKILRKGKVPILCGGTGFYIQAVIDGIILPKIKPDWLLRSILNKLSTEELFKKLRKLDPRRAKTIDKKNKRRLIRALEIVLKTGKPVPLPHLRPWGFGGQAYPVLMIGIKKEKNELDKLIEKRFFKWLEQGFLKEVQKLKRDDLSTKRIEEFGINYRTAIQYLEGKINDEEFIKNSLKELKDYARRQMTWFKRDSRINWVKNQKEAEKLTKKFLQTK